MVFLARLERNSAPVSLKLLTTKIKLRNVKVVSTSKILRHENLGIQSKQP